jgi:hypothetical protein
VNVEDPEGLKKSDDTVSDFEKKWTSDEVDSIITIRPKFPVYIG